MEIKHKAKILITTDELLNFLGYVGGRIFQVRLDDDSFDDCIAITVEHDSLPETRPGEVLQNIKWNESPGYYRPLCAGTGEYWEISEHSDIAAQEDTKEGG